MSGGPAALPVVFSLCPGWADAGSFLVLSCLTGGGLGRTGAILPRGLALRLGHLRRLLLLTLLRGRGLTSRLPRRGRLRLGGLSLFAGLLCCWLPYLRGLSFGGTALFRRRLFVRTLPA